MVKNNDKIMYRLGDQLLVALAADSFSPAAYVLNGKRVSDVRPLGVFSKFATNVEDARETDGVSDELLDEIRKTSETPEYKAVWERSN